MNLAKLTFINVVLAQTVTKAICLEDIGPGVLTVCDMVVANANLGIALPAP